MRIRIIKRRLISLKNNENILDFIFNARSEELAKLTKEDREFLNSLETNINKEYQEFIDLLENLPKETKNNIIEKVNTYSDTSDFIHAYYYKKYYKLGFSECMKLILSCIG